MNIGLVMLLCLAWFFLGYRVWAPRVERWLGVEPSRPTPAVLGADDVDFVPTRPAVLFGHHFASIAAAGPIVGPALALAYGVVPVLAWLLIGVVFVGAVHDASALFVSVREGGRSIAEIARSTLGNAGFLLYSAFALMLCVLVSAAFLDITARTLTAHVPLEALGLQSGQGGLATTVRDGIEMARVGGVASTSVIVITALAPLLGVALTRRRLPTWGASLFAIVGCVLSVGIGVMAPLSVEPTTWMVVVLAYTVVAGFLPVWWIIQPRDFMNVHFLYAGLVVMVLSILGCGIFGVTVDMPAFNVAGASKLPGLGALWPVLFVTVACGSVSGAHGLVAGGTTSKQVISESHIRPVGYGAMLLESLLGVCVLLLLVGAIGRDGYFHAVWDEGAPGVAVAFAMAVGKGIHLGLGRPEGAPWLVAYGTVFGTLLLEGFLVTTIDTLVRLSRYLLEEIWSVVFTRPPSVLRLRWFNTLLVVLPVALLGFGSGYRTVWPVFGGANQLLASLTLVAVAAWLAERGRPVAFVALPAGFMMLTTGVALIQMTSTHLREGAWALAAASSILWSLALGVLVVVGRVVWARRRVDAAEPG